MIKEEESAVPGHYRLNVDYYGADFPAGLLVMRMNESEFIIPGFQREYVWKEVEASRFIESILFGLPTPALFLARDKFSERYLVVDGQQRLKTLQYFFNGKHPNGRDFRLKGVSPELEGKTYSELPPSARRSLNNAVIHCIIIADTYDPIGMFHLFERLNTTGTPLNTQEIRNALYHGELNELLKELAGDETWRQLYGKSNNRAEEQELILRFFALRFALDQYRGSMVDFLNEFMLENKDFDHIPRHELEREFRDVIDFVSRCVGPGAFRHGKTFSRVLFDTIMLMAASKRSEEGGCERFRRFHKELLEDAEFWSMSQHATTSRMSIFGRLDYSEMLYSRS